MLVYGYQIIAVLDLDAVAGIVTPVSSNNRTVQNCTYRGVVLNGYVYERMPFGRTVGLCDHAFDRWEEEHALELRLRTGRTQAVFLYGVYPLPEYGVSIMTYGLCGFLGSFYSVFRQKAVQGKRLLAGYDAADVGQLEGHYAHAGIQGVDHGGILNGFALSGVGRVSGQNPL